MPNKNVFTMKIPPEIWQKILKFIARIIEVIIGFISGDAIVNIF